jgi:rhamnogalacturonan endolyase
MSRQPAGVRRRLRTRTLARSAVALTAAAAMVAAPAVTRSVTAAATPAGTAALGQFDHLDRGLISVRSGGGNLVSWRWLATDPDTVAFNLYRDGTRVNARPITGRTDYLDAGAPAGASYRVRAVVDGVEQAASATSLPFAAHAGDGVTADDGAPAASMDIPLSKPAGGTTPDGVAYTYTANDVSVGDLDGDGQYEFVVKWDPTNSKDNSQSGYTGDVYVDAYKQNGTRMWRIDLGRNIRAGQHYTQFQVFDYDGDGKAEVAMKTADATVDGAGKVIGDANADYRNSSGYVLDGPEYLTMFNGQTGAAMDTVDYDPPRGDVCDWGDCYGNRVDRFLAGTAYLDGSHPSLIESRGYYTRTVITAWDWNGSSLTERWKFDSNSAGSQYEDQGDHQLAIADVDGDGRDEIVFGAMAIDDNGKPLWNTGYGHGDAMDVGDLDPNRAGLEEYKVDENTGEPAAWMADAATGKTLWTRPSCGCDNGRGRSDHIWSGSPGAQSWSADGGAGIYDTSGTQVSSHTPSSDNFVVWWGGDLVRDLLDDTHIDRYDPSGDTRVLTASGVHSDNGTKAVPALSADLFGDWREEVVWPTSNDTALRIYSTDEATDHEFTSLMQDRQYREAIAWQNTAYNQPPHTSYYIGDDQPPSSATANPSRVR